MAIITNYATLQTAIGDYLNRSDLTTFLPNFTQACESKLYKQLRINAMETALSVAISGGVATVPADYLELKYAYVDTTPVQFLKRSSPEEIYSRYSVRAGTADIPRLIAREASNFIFGPYPADYTIKGIYYKRLTALSGSNTTNWFTTNAPDVLLYGSLLEAAPFLLNDERIPLWKSAYDFAMKNIQDEEMRERYSGSSKQIRLG